MTLIESQFIHLLSTGLLQIIRERQKVFMVLMPIGIFEYKYTKIISFVKNEFYLFGAIINSGYWPLVGERHDLNSMG